MYFLKNKSEVADCIRKFVLQVKVNLEYKIKKMRSDNGKEFVDHQVRSEREIRTVTEAARTMLL